MNNEVRNRNRRRRRQRFDNDAICFEAIWRRIGERGELREKSKKRSTSRDRMSD